MRSGQGRYHDQDQDLGICYRKAIRPSERQATNVSGAVYIMTACVNPSLWYIWTDNQPDPGGKPLRVLAGRHVDT